MGIMLNFPPPEEGIHHQESNVICYAGEKEIGKGTLYISESVFCFSTDKGEGFSLDYPSIFIHAISRDITHFPHECLFIMIDGKLNLDEAVEKSADSELIKGLSSLRVEEIEDEDDEESIPPIQMRFVPENKHMLDVMFRAISDCQALNPDPADVSEGEGDFDCFPSFNIQNGIVDVDEVEEEEGECDMDEDQFEDAED